MLVTLQSILLIGSQFVTIEPSIIAIVENAIAAFKSNDQASLDDAHNKAVALAQSLAPQ